MSTPCPVCWHEEHQSPVLKEITRNEGDPSHGVDLLKCAELRADLDQASEAFKSWAVWEKPLCEAHQVEWAAALLQADAR